MKITEELNTYIEQHSDSEDQVLQELLNQNFLDTETVANFKNVYTFIFKKPSRISEFIAKKFTNNDDKLWFVKFDFTKGFQRVYVCMGKLPLYNGNHL